MERKPGRTPHLGPRTQVVVNLRTEQYERLRRLADSRQQAMAHLIRHAVDGLLSAETEAA